MNILPLICVCGVLWGEVCDAPAPESPALKFASESQRHMATDFTIQVHHRPEQDPRPALAAAFAKIASLDRMMTDYDPSSELSRLSAGAPHEKPVPVSADLAAILRHAERVSRDTEGAFDVTVGPLTRLWRQARRQKRIADEEKRTAALATVGWRNLEITHVEGRDFVRLHRPGMRLDLGGIAQGYAVDVAFEMLVEAGYRHILINASGDIRVGEAPPGEPGWKIGLTALAPNAPPEKFIYLAKTSISTSGDVFQFVEFEGQRYSHIVDPATGLGVTTPMSVSVVAPSCTQADAYASALCVLGPERSRRLAAVGQGELTASFVLQTEDGVRAVALPGWEKLDVRAVPRECGAHERAP
jgi:FAD:protein FMN transferase